jgi:hypothetical protein
MSVFLKRKEAIKIPAAIAEGQAANERRSEENQCSAILRARTSSVTLNCAREAGSAMTKTTDGYLSK